MASVSHPSSKCRGVSGRATPPCPRPPRRRTGADSGSRRGGRAGWVVLRVREACGAFRREQGRHLATRGYDQVCEGGKEVRGVAVDAEEDDARADGALGLVLDVRVDCVAGREVLAAGGIKIGRLFGRSWYPRTPLCTRNEVHLARWFLVSSILQLVGVGVLGVPKLL